MTDRQLILHIGAGKCGSSALQTALSHQPALTGTGGQHFRYMTLGGVLNPDRLLDGPRLQLHAAASAYGYMAFPAVPKNGPTETYFAAINSARRRGLRGGFVPILSNEGWLGQAPLFAKALAAMRYPPVEAVAFLRAPVDWLNAAYWQWGVWSHPHFDRWYGGPRCPYTVAEDLEGWAAIPNLQLHVFSARTDVVTSLAGHLGVALNGTQSANRASPPSLIGFLLRNREFRPDAHTPLTEFVYQRWCPPLFPRKPWAVRPADVQALRPLAQRTVERLQQLLPPGDLARLFADPRWQRELPYHAEILQLPTPLHLLADLPMLWDSLTQGIAAASGHAPAPALPAPPPPDSDHATWDAVLAVAMNTLLILDEAVRERAPKLAASGS